jgi:hypothetical protein
VLLTWLDDLAYDEAWVGEHHSAGWEYISPPELLLAVAAERTKHLRSYELLARHVMPRSKGALAGVDSAYHHAMDNRLRAQQATKQAIDRAFEAREHGSANGPVL